MSDLHLDISKVNPILAGGDVLILAGDTCEAIEFRKMTDEQYEFMKSKPAGELSNRQRINFFFRECSEKYKHVVMIAGNHESYNYNVDFTVKHMRDNLPDNFHVLDKDTFEFEDVLFVGGTMWTDCNKNDPLTMHALKYGMNDFHVIKKTTSTGEVRTWSPDDTVAEHERTLQYFKLILDNPANVFKKIVVVSHHAPTSLSLDDRYKGEFLMNGGYHSRLDDFILDHPQIKYWIHGHTHQQFNYLVGDYTRVICNPRGYQGRNFSEETNWDPNFTIEL